MLFRQLFEEKSHTYSYLLADRLGGEAVLIDGVYATLERDVRLVEELGLRLRYCVETHVHADHVTSAYTLRARLGCKVALSADAGAANVDVALRDGDSLRFGAEALRAIATPGHTRGCMTYVWQEHGMAFVGDALLIRGCGRTDFQQGNAKALYHSVRTRIFGLGDETLLYPAHDYKGHTVTSVAEERRHNPRLGDGMGEEAFVSLMAGLRLDYPKMIDIAVPLNLSGAPPPNDFLAPTS